MELTDEKLYQFESMLQKQFNKNDFNGVEFDVEKNEIMLDKEKFQDIMDVFYPGRYRIEETEENEDYIFVSLHLFNTLKLRCLRE